MARYGNRYFQLEPRSENYAPARGKVRICEGPDGRVTIEYRGHAVRWQEIAAPARPITQEKRSTAVGKTAKPKWVPPADHPWREAAWRQMARKTQAGAGQPRSWDLPSAAP